jgi:hypothetical protein
MVESDESLSAVRILAMREKLRAIGERDNIN